MTATGAYASMRPRPDAAENARLWAAAHVGGAGFNEAAARCRGKHMRGIVIDGPDGAGASMRPRPDAAENPR